MILQESYQYMWGETIFQICLGKTHNIFYYAAFASNPEQAQLIKPSNFNWKLFLANVL